MSSTVCDVDGADAVAITVVQASSERNVSTQSVQYPEGASVQYPKGSAAQPGALYTVVVEERPAGFRSEGNVILVVNKYGKMHTNLLPDSRVVKVNDLDVNFETFENTFISTPIPLTLTLEGPPYEVESGSNGSGADGQISKKLFINFLLHYFSVFIDFFGILVTAPVAPFLMPLMGFNESELGLLISIYNAASIPGAMLCGWLTSRWGTRVVILYSLLGSSLTLAAQGLIINLCLHASNPHDRKFYYSFLAVRVAGGLTGSSMPVTMTFIGMKCPPAKKPKYMAAASVCLTAAVMIGPMVGGTLANFTPQYSVPFYVGALVAFIGFLIAVCMLETAKPPSRKGKKSEPMSKPLISMMLVSLFIQLIYGSYIIMGVAYYMWRFGLKPEEVGSVLSLHGVIQSTNNIFVVPRLMKRYGQNKAYMIGCILLVIGTSVVGFMDTWWAFQILWSPIVGMGFGIVRTGTNVICDRFASMANKPKVNALIFTLDQAGLFLAGIIYGKVLEFAKDNGEGSYFWLPVAGISALFTISYALIWCCVLRPHDTKKKAEDEKAKLAAHQHKIEYVSEAPPTDAEYMEYGRFFVDLLHKRNWYWRTKSFFIKRIVDDFFVELPTDTLDHRMDIVWEVEERARRGKEIHEQIDAFYEELSLLQAPGATPA